MLKIETITHMKSLPEMKELAGIQEMHERTQRGSSWGDKRFCWVKEYVFGKYFVCLV